MLHCCGQDSILAGAFPEHLVSHSIQALLRLVLRALPVPAGVSAGFQAFRDQKIKHYIVHLYRAHKQQDSHAALVQVTSGMRLQHLGVLAVMHSILCYDHRILRHLHAQWCMAQLHANNSRANNDHLLHKQLGIYYVSHVETAR